MPSRRIPQIHIVSDGRGETCMQFVKAALVQYPDKRYRIVRTANVLTPEEVRRVVAKAAKADAVLFYTLVGEETRREMAAASQELLVPVLDVLGPAFSALYDLFQSARGSTPGLLYASEREEFDRYGAIDFTLKHDDGQRPEDLKQADVILVGVSRASKSSTCFYLAYQGVRAANVPLLQGIPPPPELLKVDPKKVVGLRVNVNRLMTVREVRVSAMGMGAIEGYVDKRAIAREVMAANRLMEERGWASVDVSYMAIEEIAKEVLRLRGR